MPEATCKSEDHRQDNRHVAELPLCERAAGIFAALGDPRRLQLLSLLHGGEMCVSEIADALSDNLPAVSQRLKLLRGESIVSSRRAGKHVYYSLDDQHVVDLVSNALAHAEEHRR
ncbi:MAG: metalloregulator ArsR/SmtB family transcription factor [Planctomycetota bacterium]|nr:metalloregulator ArsR/SmtB family transcription factor [Planctomycetota bacterium]MEE3219016.1 metalloregulator ArsR/SmtB family transcription factor [Planctomycetota bacterium]